MSFGPAGTQELLRAHQRDQEQQSYLTTLTRDVARSVFGERMLLDKGPVLDLLSSLAYYSLTFGRGSQTLGEEYVDVLPVTNLHSSPASVRRRRLALLFTILLPHGLPLLARHLRHLSPDPASEDEPSPSDAPFSRRALLARARAALDSVEALGPLLGDLGLAWFFLRGGPLEWGKRLAGISYISTLPPPPEGPSSPRYRLIGFLLLFPILRRLIAHILPHLTLPAAAPATADSEKPPAPARSNFTLPSGALPLGDNPPSYPTETSPPDPPPSQDADVRKCTLCLEQWSAPAVTECGHVFCWTCVVGWSAEKEECPLCRQSLNPSRLQPVYNL